MHVKQAGRGPELFLIHGWMMNGLCWREVVASLEHRFRLTMVDLPGHGSSLQSRYSLGRPEQLCDGLLELAPAGAVWIGWSLGGLLAQLATQNASRGATGHIRALISVGMSARCTAAPGWPCGVNRVLFRAFSRLFTISPERLVRQLIAQQVLGSERQAPARRVLKMLAEMPWDKRELRAGLELLRTTDVRGALRTVDKPILFLAGNRDLVVSNESLKHSSLLAPRGRYAEIRGAGHAPFLSHCEEFTAAVSGFIDALD